MALKRSVIDTESSDLASKSCALRKRARMSSSTADRSDSSVLSSASVSQASTMWSSPEAALRVQDSSVSSLPSSGDGHESDSSMADDSASSTSCEEEEDDDESESGSETVVTLGAPKKPVINTSVLSGANDLASRLKAFLPQMRQANSKLAESGAGLNMEAVDDDEAHIEMSLGLGVLEQEKEEDIEDMLRKKATSGEDEQSDSSDQVSEAEPDVLDRLMNMERDVVKAEQPSIEEVECRPSEDVGSSTAAAPSSKHRHKLALRQSLQSRPS